MMSYRLQAIDVLSDDVAQFRGDSPRPGWQAGPNPATIWDGKACRTVTSAPA